jgi:hypothetical protein
MSRFRIISIGLAFSVATLQPCLAAMAPQTPAKKVAAPTAKIAAKPAAPIGRAAAPVARVATPAVASPRALQAAAQSTVTGGARSPASVMGASNSGGNSKDISEELKIMGQSRNLSMGLLFQKDKDKLTFGTPRTNYEDKVSDKKANF